ncbi:Glucose-methanol-choline oxidoreductase OS=Tsukamurella paurometabola (strain ATCC 8368 / DSM/ CCUG 35730 / CIP 100753 / JCM 10117 / KCTC 9821 / NBRC 16120/ NCIMB 702349 / NCTC 13040) OX=521096 GN=Tpau_2557 PE=3 SV=1 [Tsukamurella paurometabola]|uniref:Glucose-methanol-choline oxidoreductase n=1 Tax=Tsukamurella paurometabola (strain ATCC 8368 / DSM 20162 / CCUG 35730 / CIP 100753 / JCM 10117 / KCTC 9821 / NBRC 16120 / NCIMB 702349 / NCTC 13040) TaxID=521096 RepID=D5URV5_TSUPD|nr:GMC family oxidoreductase N-terminal domain-containing protein [Tsukamurella paurometabola]ADG79160.1 glucose-methanol-choline oxidoreductase [Tsukamurella paurometabola DSM 20162]SUP34336.1 Alcohol dehydrogenase [acceptor] [Tsukamurella paurometabola]
MASDEYDYIVVGAGSAGAVVAARLTEDPGTSVLLLEAGGEADADEIQIPLAFASLFKTKWDWNYTTTPQKHLDDRTTYWPRMKALGGCSSMNAMIYIRGNHSDYNAWANDFGADGWSYDEVLPYFTKAEGNTSLGDRYHGTSGPLNVEDRVYTHPLVDAWVDSAVSFGLARNGDFNGATQDGAGRYQVTCKGGRRWSTDKAYIEPARSRPNLTVALGATARHIDFDGDRACGITFAQGGSEHSARARKEVILSGGTVNSPQLLMLSGIGPAEHLAEHGIDVRVALPGVGENLHDHPIVPVIFDTHGSTDLMEAQNLKNLLRWKIRGTGPLASNAGEAGGFFRSREDLDLPDLQYHVMASGFYDNMLHEPTARGLVCGPTLVNVASRGRLRLRSANPDWHPSLEPNYFEAPEDLEAMLVGTRAAFELCQQGPLARYLGKPWHLPEKPTEDDYLAHIRQYAQTLFHPVGTCAMGSGEGAVVDSQLRVRGTEGLRVVDASVMPMITRGNTNAPTIMIAEKAADEIRRSA